MPPAISILLPACNAATTLDTCVGSVVRQTERDWECILVDDGSADDTLGPPTSSKCTRDASATSSTARAEVRVAMASLRLREAHDFVCAA